MIRGFNGTVATAIVVLAATPVRAELTLCNRTSYRMDAAIGLEKRATVATRGWFRIDPGQCRQVVDGALDADMVYLHARTPPVYGSTPLPSSVSPPVMRFTSMIGSMRTEPSKSFSKPPGPSVRARNTSAIPPEPIERTSS